ncbi:MAG: 23S rRNA (uracil(1939)-C(5))-methyltransferase RlmD [Candidatus Korobacteraceae bacterium]|jgi:23S rRNA (uracil1939-C5)-methyltransferase
MPKVTIEKMIYGGDGLGRLRDAPPSPGESGSRNAQAGERGKAVFVPFVLADEVIDVEIVEQRPGFDRGRAVSLLSTSPQRVEPGCPYFCSCGGCQYQHAGYEHQLAMKQHILRDALRRTAKVELAVELKVHASPPWNYRNRTRMKVTNLPEFAIGYFEHGSHRLLSIEHCPISSPLINRALQALWQSSEFRSLAGDIAEVQFFANHDDRAILLEIFARKATSAEAFRPAFQALKSVLPELRGLALFQYTGEDERDRTTGPLGFKRGTPEFLGERGLTYVTSEGSFRVDAGAFFQTNRFLVDELLSTVLTSHEGRRALDLYAGVGLFSVPLSRRFQRVTAVEIAPLSVDALRANSGGRVEVVAAATEQFLRGFHAPAGLDLVVVDPPRAGLGERTARALARLKTSELIYVSCDPATLSRDLRVLVESGFHIEEAHLVDLFPQTFHIETVFRLAR